MLKFRVYFIYIKRIILSKLFKILYREEYKNMSNILQKKIDVAKSSL